MRNKAIAALMIASMLTSSVLLAGGAPAISVNLIRCAAPNIHPRVTASVQPDAVSGRVYFMAAGNTDEYYVDMTKNGQQSMTALLPMPARETRSFRYRVATMDRKGKETTSSPVSVDVQASCPTGEQTAALVLGLTQPTQSPVPNGFQCTNVVRYVTSTGMMMNNDECRRILAGVPPASAPAAVAPAATTAGTAATAPAAGVAATTAGAETAAAAGATVVTGAGLSAATIAALTALGLGLGYAAYRSQQNDEPVSPARP